MSRSAMLTLARQHNDVNQVQRITTFPELAACCRRLLYSHFAEDAKDDEEYFPNIPQFKSLSSIQGDCLTLLVNSLMGCG